MRQSFKVKSFKFSGFRSFVEEQDTGLLPDSGLFGIVGKNNDTSGSSGSGKSNFHLALSYALGYCPFPATELQSWLTSNPMQVELLLETPEGEVIIKRGNETSISLDGVKFDGARAVENKLKSIFKWPIELIEALTFRQQKKPGRFLAMTDGEKKDFLGALLGLRNIEDQIEVSNEKIKDLERDYSELLTVATTLKSRVKVPVAPALKDSSGLKGTALAVSEQITELKQRVKGLFDIYIKNQEMERQVQDEPVLPFNGTLFWDETAQLRDDINWQKICDAQYKDLLTETIRNCENKLISLKKDLPRPIASVEQDIQTLKTKIAGFENETCLYCNQAWHPHRDWIEAAQKNLVNLELELERVSEITYKISKNQAEIISSKDSLVNFKNSNLAALEKKLEVKIQEAESERIKLEGVKKNKIIELRKLNEPDLNKYLESKKNLESAEALLLDINESIKDLERENKGLESDYSIQLKAYNSLLLEIETVDKRALAFKKAMEEELDFVQMLKGFLGAIFSEILEEIALEANGTLKQLPNVASTTIRFDTEVLSQKGKARQEIKPVIIKNGTVIPVKSGLSGGQFTSVELATDLAISKIIGQRTGLFLNWLVLDESFDGHDVPVKEACLELLKIAAQDRLIFVIDHATEVNEYFDKCITIESNNDRSSIKSIA